MCVGPDGGSCGLPRGAVAEEGGRVELTFQQQKQVREFVLGGYSDEEIAQAMLISVKQVRPIRLAVEAAVRPR